MLPVLPGQEDAFAAALHTALPLIWGSPGFRRLSVSRGVYDPFPVVAHFAPVVETDGRSA